MVTARGARTPGYAADPWWLTALRWPLWSWQRLVITVAVFVVLTSAASVAQDRLSRALGGRTATATATPAATAVAGLPGATPTGLPPTDEEIAAGAGLTGVGGVKGSGVPTGAGAGTAGGSASPSASPSAPVTAEQARAAWTFVAAWARPDEPAATWYAALVPLSTIRLATLLKDTDPGRVPASRVLDPSPAASGPAGRTAASGAAATKKARPTPTPAAGSSLPAVVPFGTTQAVTVRTDAGAVVVGLLWDGTHWLVDSIAPTGQPG